MAHALDELLSSGMLSEEVRSSISEAWNTKLAEARDSIATELREEFAQRYENDKAKIVEGMDAILSEVITKELEEFKEDKAKVTEDRVAYRKHMKEHAKVLDTFVMETLRKEITELREDRVAQDKHLNKLEGFVLEQLTKELNEFHDDKRSLVEAKVNMIREGKAVIQQTKKKFINESAKKVDQVLESVLKKELTTLKEDIKTAKENNFGRKIFETFAAEFMSSYLVEGTQVAKLSKEIDKLSKKLHEAHTRIARKDVELKESQKKIRMVQDSSERSAIMNEMMTPLSKQHREVMNALLESVQTADLRKAFNKYLPSVLNEQKVDAQPKKKVLSESTKEITGNKANSDVFIEETAEIINLRKLAGIN